MPDPCTQPLDVPSGRVVAQAASRLVWWVVVLTTWRCVVAWRQSGQTRDAATLGTLCEFTCEWFRRQSEDVLMQLSAVLQV